MRKPKIALITDNPNKADEYRRFYGRYGIQPLIVSPKDFYGYECEDYNYGAIADRFLVKEGYDQVIREESGLDGPRGETLEEIVHMDVVRQWTRAHVYSISPGGELICHKHEAFMRGYIDTMADDTGQGFDWDVYFVPESHVDTLSGYAARNLKLSGRDLVLTEASKKHLLFDEPVELNFLDASGKSLVDFNRMPLDVLGDVPWLTTDAFKASPVNRLLGTAVERGAFFRYEKIVGDHGHFSVAHTTSISILVAGLSCAVENEFNSQRDLVHASRITEARTQVQDSPPLVVPDERLIPAYEAIMRTIDEERMSISSLESSASETDAAANYRNIREALNLMMPASKATAIQLTGTLRNFQKLLDAQFDEGKEAEYRQILSYIRTPLNYYWPLLFERADEYRPTYYSNPAPEESVSSGPRR